MLRVLGVDPGLTRCGVGVVEVAPNRRARLVHVTVVRTPADMALEQRLLRIADGIAAEIDEHRPDAVAVERVFAQANVRTVMGTAQAAGLALHAAAARGLPVGLHTPSEVKAAVTGYGNADKRQVQTMIARVLGLDEVPKPADAADALALAVCHAWRLGSPDRVGPARRRSPPRSVPGVTRRPVPRTHRWRGPPPRRRARARAPASAPLPPRGGPAPSVGGPRLVGMIASLRGTCIDVSGSAVVVEVGGVGYAVTVTPAHALTMRLGSEVFLRTAMIVREDEHLLFGFESTDALQVFDLLRSVSGVGPKSALGVLAHLDPAQVANAVASEDDAAFRKVSGIGPKTAKLITVALSGKLVAFEQAPTAAAGARAVAHPATVDVVSALVGLGWREDAAQSAVDAVVANDPGAAAMGTQALLRAALGTLRPAGAGR